MYIYLFIYLCLFIDLRWMMGMGMMGMMECVRVDIEKVKKGRMRQMEGKDEGKNEGENREERVRGMRVCRIRTGGNANPTSHPATMVPSTNTALNSLSLSFSLFPSLSPSPPSPSSFIPTTTRSQLSVILAHNVLKCETERFPPGRTCARMRFVGFCQN